MKTEKAGTFAGTAPERSGVSADAKPRFGRRKLCSPDFSDGGFLPKAATTKKAGMFAGNGLEQTRLPFQISNSRISSSTVMP